MSHQKSQLFEFKLEHEKWCQGMPDGNKIIIERPEGTKIGDLLRYKYNFQTKTLTYSPSAMTSEEMHFYEQEMAKFLTPVHCLDDRIRCWHLREDCELCSRNWLEENDKLHDDETWFPNLAAKMAAEMASLPPDVLLSLPRTLMKEAELPPNHPYSYKDVDTKKLAELRESEKMAGMFSGRSEEDTMKMLWRFRLEDITHARGGTQGQKIKEGDKSCDFCGITTTGDQKMKRCSACKSAWYCSVEHQKKHWKKEHKEKCAGTFSKKNKKKKKKKTEKTKKTEKQMYEEWENMQDEYGEEEDEFPSPWIEAVFHADLEESSFSQFAVAEAYMFGGTTFFNRYDNKDEMLPLDFQQNEQLASRYYYRAASNGHPGAMLKLGRNYAHGIGVEKNLKKAKHWFLKTKEHNYQESGHNYQEGMEFEGMSIDQMLENVDKEMIQGGDDMFGYSEVPLKKYCKDVLEKIFREVVKGSITSEVHEVIAAVVSRYKHNRPNKKIDAPDDFGGLIVINFVKAELEVPQEFRNMKKTGPM